jgi:hypothetical protein
VSKSAKVVLGRVLIKPGPMSASAPKATELLRRQGMTRCAKNGSDQASKLPAWRQGSLPRNDGRHTLLADIGL